MSVSQLTYNGGGNRFDGVAHVLILAPIYLLTLQPCILHGPLNYR